ncbi:MAG: hypothetical protein WC777_03710 [Candidatus Gracilibacteria bacterium]|jgi:hypothetical protein
MKKIIASFVLFLASCGLLASPLALADNGYSGFDVKEILDLDAEDNQTNDSTEIYENITDEATERGVSVPAAIILRIINILTLLIGTVTFVVIMIGGFMMVTAGGDEGQVDKAKGILSQAIVGCLLAFFAYFITVFIQSFFY